MPCMPQRFYMNYVRAATSSTHLSSMSGRHMPIPAPAMRRELSIEMRLMLWGPLVRHEILMHSYRLDEKRVPDY